MVRGLRGPHILILNNGDRIWQLIRGDRTMPIFEYICQQCDHEFEALVYGRQKAECPKSHSKKLSPQLSTFAVSSKSGASMSAPSPCGSCGDPGGPGTCSRRGFN